MANPTGPPDHMNSSMYSRRLNPQGSPESEFNNFECFQNYTAPEVFVQGLAGIVNQGDVAVMIRAQKQMYKKNQLCSYSVYNSDIYLYIGSNGSRKPTKCCSTAMH